MTGERVRKCESVSFVCGLFERARLPLGASKLSLELHWLFGMLTEVLDQVTTKRLSEYML